MSSAVRRVDDDTAVTVGLLVAELSAVLGGNVALVAVQDPDGRLAFLAAPGAERSIFRYLGSVDWHHAEILAAEHTDQ